MSRLPETAAPTGPRMPLRDALVAAAAEMNRAAPPPGLERAVLLRLAALSPARRRRSWWAWPGAAAVAAALALSILMLVPPDPGLPQADHRQATGFLPLVGAHILLEGPTQSAAAWVVPAEMPRDRLAALGLPYDPARAGDNVRAELLMSSAGQVLAVRLLPE